MFKTQRFPEHCAELNQVLNTIKLEKLWTDWVRQDLRSQALFDLHDYYDFHLFRKEKICKLITTIFDGTYQPSRPNRVRKEKNQGIARHLVILRPEDALLLEALGQFLYSFVDTHKPSEHAFFSRKHKQLNSIEGGNTPYNWWELWPLFQDKICGFSEIFKYIVVTDIATYYDSISMQSLRNSIASTGKFSEGFLDFLFFMIEHFVWRPDYIPYSGKGLPQINLETPRVLAHAFLFDIDRFLKRKTLDNFVRWMDDIDFGCNDINQAKKILQELDDLLLSKGLHLNSSKTKILSEEDIDNHFFFNENIKLNILSNEVSIFNSKKNLYIKKIYQLKKGYHDFRKHNSGNSEKVIKRYIGVFKKLKCSSFDKNISELLANKPGLRDSIFLYLMDAGWSSFRQEILIKYILECLDDESLLKGVKVLLDWDSSSPTTYRIDMVKLAQRLLSKKDSMAHVLASLWLHCKFSTTKQLGDFVLKNIMFWRARPWMARQFASTWPFLSKQNREILRSIIYRNGLTDARSVIDNYERIGDGTKEINIRIMPYLEALSNGKKYPIHKILIARAFLDGSASQELKNKLANDSLIKIRDTRSRILLLKLKI